MGVRTLRDLGALAEQRWGLLTTTQAESVRVTRKQLSRLTEQGALVRVAQGVYRVAGAPELELEPVYAAWLAVGGANSTADGQNVPPVVAAGQTAARVHQIGDFYPDGVEFIVPRRRGTRLPGVRLRTRQLEPWDVGWVNGLPTLTVEATIVDLVVQWMDRSLVADALGEAIDRGILTAPDRLATGLAPLAAANGYPAEDGQSFTADLIALSGRSITAVG